MTSEIISKINRDKYLSQNCPIYPSISESSAQTPAFSQSLQFFLYPLPVLEPINFPDTPMSPTSTTTMPPRPDMEKSSAPLPDPSDLTSYPEGGTRAWLVVLGAWCGLTASIGLYNTTGVFSVIIFNTILISSSSTSIGWIFSIYAFMVWIVGVWVGPCFDVFGPRMLMMAGMCCTVLGMVCLSFCTGGFVPLFCVFAPH